MILRADSQGVARIYPAELARRLRIRRETARSVLSSLNARGVMDVLERPSRHCPGAYRVRASRLPGVPQSQDVLESGQRTHLGRAATHRIQIGEEHARTLLDVSRSRLSELEALLAYEHAKITPEQRLLWMQERDQLELDLVPKLTAHLDLFRKSAT